MRIVSVFILTILAGAALCNPAHDPDHEITAKHAAENTLKGLRKCCPVGQMIGKAGACITMDTDEEIWYPVHALTSENKKYINSLDMSSLDISVSETGFPCTTTDKSVAIYDGVGTRKEFVINAENGSITIGNDGGDTIGTFSASEYCVDRMSFYKTNVWIAFYCPCLVKTCIRKCCPRGQAYNVTSHSCENSYPDWAPQIFNASLLNQELLPMTKEDFNKEYFIMTGFPYCTTFRLNDDKRSFNDFYLLENGHVRIPLYDNKEYSREEYCLDTFIGVNWVESSDTVICFPEVKNDLSLALYANLALASSCFLFATFVFYTFWVKNKTVHEKTLMGHVAGMFFAFIFLSINQLFSQNFGVTACMAIGYLQQLAFISAFIWLQVMCVDVWKTLLDLLAMVKTRQWSNSSKRFKHYLVYACAVPVIWTLITVLVDLTSGKIDFPVTPGIGIESCWLSGDLSLLVYFYAPIGLILVSNLMLCILAVAVQRQIHSEIESLRLDYWQLHCYAQQKKRLFLCIAVYFLMGALWAMEILSWAVGGPKEVWYATDILNCLQGVLIFILFVCCKKYFSPTMDTRTKKDSFLTEYDRCTSDTTPIWKE